MTAAATAGQASTSRLACAVHLQTTAAASLPDCRYVLAVAAAPSRHRWRLLHPCIIRTRVLISTPMHAIAAAAPHLASAGVLLQGHGAAAAVMCHTLCRSKSSVS
jgi:hypothetical protein